MTHIERLNHPQGELDLKRSENPIGAIEIKDGHAESRATVYANGALKCAQAVDAGRCTLRTYSQIVSTPGTPVALYAGSLPVWRVDIVAKPGNTGKICVGDLSVNAETNRMAELAGGESYCIECPSGTRLDLAGVYIDATMAGEGVLYNAFSVEVAG